MKKQIAADVDKTIQEIEECQIKLSKKISWGNSKNLRKLLCIIK